MYRSDANKHDNVLNQGPCTERRARSRVAPRILPQATVKPCLSNAPKDQEKHLPSFALALQQRENVFFPNGALDVSDDRPRRVVHELDAHLGNTTSGPSSSENLAGGPSQRQRVDRTKDGNWKRTLITLASLTGAFDES